MLTSLGGGLLGLLDRRLVLTAWLPSMLCWGGIGALVVTGVGWPPAAHWWLRQPAQFQVTLLVLALAWITFSAFLAAAMVPVFIRTGEGYWPELPVLTGLRARRLKAHRGRWREMQDDPGAFAWRYADYPLDCDSVLATRLGNILKAAEDHALNRYKINSVVVWPRLYAVLPDQFTSGIAAAKVPLDLMAVIGALGSVFALAGTVVAAILLPWWAPLACLAGGLLVTWLAYAGAVQAARPYAQLIRAAFDVHRGLLLDAAGLSRPTSYAAERRQWEQVSHLWQQGTPEDPALLGYPDEQPAQRHSLRRRALRSRAPSS
jgi:hypothetical protein